MPEYAWWELNDTHEPVTQSNKFVSDVNIKATSDSELNDSPVYLLQKMQFYKQ